jgi:catechol 2,3-dioxygenase-like lactoylglutathione lyase family enzyme
MGDGRAPLSEGDGMASITVRTVNLDCSDPRAMARFYGGLLGWEPTAVEPDWVLMRNPGGGTGLSFQQTEGYQPPVWPEESGRQQKMIHLDLHVGAPEDSEEEGQAALEEAVRLAVSLGGTLAEPQERTDLRVVLDPAGHPLCLFLY